MNQALLSVRGGSLKGTDRLCKVVELRMQCCGKLLSDSFETYLTLNICKS